ncbi:hypothetical protein [Sphingomonas cavernae]|uniref:hypothetical protein n=1 Tax=Sphingomonas cavernae TaxID=2320861 RepID=UPI001C720999|nr:hypothetical protein [Sphingomonas cavernae]
MPSVYVLAVPEFIALADVSREDPKLSVSDVGFGYLRIDAEDEIVFERRKLGFKPAVWYSAFTGGIEGRIVEFGRDVVRIVSDSEE